MRALHIMHVLNLHTHVHGTQASLVEHPAGGRARPSADVTMGKGVDRVPHAFPELRPQRQQPVCVCVCVCVCASV